MRYGERVGVLLGFTEVVRVDLYRLFYTTDDVIDCT